MRIFVEPFFFWQIEYEISDGQNENKAYLHGADGTLQFYKEILKTDDIKIVYRFIGYLTKKKIKGHWCCYCDSGKKIRDCHFKLIKKYKQKIRTKDARKTLEDFNNAIARIKKEDKKNY